jgi:hypothetical protein
MEASRQAQMTPRQFAMWSNPGPQPYVAGILQNHSSDIVMFDVPPPLQSRGIEA